MVVTNCRYADLHQSYFRGSAVLLLSLHAELAPDGFLKLELSTKPRLLLRFGIEPSHESSFVEKEVFFLDGIRGLTVPSFLLKNSSTSWRGITWLLSTDLSLASLRCLYRREDERVRFDFEPLRASVAVAVVELFIPSIFTPSSLMVT